MNHPTINNSPLENRASGLRRQRHSSFILQISSFLHPSLPPDPLTPRRPSRFSPFSVRRAQKQIPSSPAEVAVAKGDVAEGLAALEGMPMAVLTNKPVRFSQQLLEGLGLAKYFRYVYGGNSFLTKKPDPSGMEVLLRDFGAAPRQAMLVGDSEVDVQTARNADTWSCSVTYGLGWERLAEWPADLVIDSLVELPSHLDHRSAGGSWRRSS